MDKKDFTILQGNCLETLKTLPDNSVQCCITSPPYYGLRDYGTGHWEGGDPNCPHYRTSKYSENDCTGHKAMGELGEAVGDAIYKSVCPLCGAVRVDEQIGLEETPNEYIKRLVDVFREVKRVLKDDGTLWVNIGDTYASITSNNRNFIDEGGRGGNNPNIATRNFSNEIKQKDLIGIPWMLAFALRADGWYLRQDIIWHKLNPMPESVRDRCTKSHEYIFLLSKSPKYLFNPQAIQEEATGYDGRKDTLHKGSPKYKNAEILPGGKINSLTKNSYERWKFVESDDGEIVPIRNKRDVWSIGVNNYKGAHFATYPIELVTPCVLAGSNENDTVLDPFSGSGTTGIVALMYGRKYIGCELNKEYVELSMQRLNEDLFGEARIEPINTNNDSPFEKFSLLNLIDEKKD